MSRRRSESGFTLLEVLLTVALSSAIVLPVTAWMVLAYRQQASIITTSREDNAINFLSVYLPRDVSSASAVATTGTDCPDPAPADDDGVVLALDYADHGSGVSRIVYRVEETGGLGTLVRRVCTIAGSSGTPAPLGSAPSTPIADHLQKPAAGWHALVAVGPRPTAAGYPADDQGRVTVTLTGSSGHPLSVTADLRTGPPR